MPDSGTIKPYISADELIARMRKYHPDDDMDLVRRAYDFAEKAHAHQLRKSGDPYFCHPCAVAVILSDLMLDATTIAAGFLHDCAEDCDGVTVESLRQMFGSEVALLVDGVIGGSIEPAIDKILASEDLSDSEKIKVLKVLKK